MKWAFLLVMIFLTECSHQATKTMNLYRFKIEVPVTWRYVKRQGVDSFVGEIKGPGIDLEFDCSDHGYAGTTVLSPDEYIRGYIARNYSKAFNRPGVKYVNPDAVAWWQDFEMKRKGVTDSALVKVRAIIKPDITVTNLDSARNEFQVALQHRDSIITFTIRIPEELTRYEIKIDTVDNFRVKTYWPKVPGQGETGAYFKELNSNFDLGIRADSLSLKKQNQALKAFSTIKFLINR